jgi:hypothetical protein
MAKASARPSTRQLVTISPTKIDSRLLISNMKACMNWSITMTIEATMVIWMISRIDGGI